MTYEEIKNRALASFKDFKQETKAQLSDADESLYVIAFIAGFKNKEKDVIVIDKFNMPDYFNLLKSIHAD